MTSAESTEAPERRRVVRPPTTRNVLLYWGSFAFGVGVNFFISPYIVHHLGNTQYGVWVLLASVVGYMGLLDLGVRSAVMRYVARHHARHEDDEASRTASTALAIFGTLGVVAIVATVVIAVVLDHLFTIPPGLLTIARIVLILGGLNIAAAMTGGVLGGTVAAMQRFDLSSLTEIGVGAARAVAIIVALAAKWDLVGLALIQLVCTFARMTILFAVTRRLYPELRFRKTDVDRTYFRKIFSFGVYSSILHFSNTLIYGADSAVIGAFSPVANITFFAICASLVDYTGSIVSGISQTVTPRASAMQAVDATRELERVMLRTAALASLVALPITITLILRGRSFIGLWMGPSYALHSGLVLPILAIAYSLAAARRVVLSATIGMNRHRVLGPFYAAEGLINLGMSIYWIRIGLGIEGVALGTAVPNVVTTLLVIPWHVRRMLGTSVRQIFTRLWVRPLLALVPFAAATYGIERIWPAHSLVDFFASIAVVLPIAFAGAWFGVFSGDERREYARSVRGTVEGLLARG